MEKKVGFKLHKVKKNWMTIGVSTLSMVALAGGALLADQSAQADEVSLPNGDGFEQTDAGIESSASLINESYSPTLTEGATHVSAVPSNYGSQTSTGYESSSSVSTGGSSQTVVGGGAGQVSSSQTSQVVGTQNSNSSQSGSAYQSSSSSASVSASASSFSSSSSSAWYSYSSSSSWSSSSASGFATITTSSSDSNGIHWNGGRNTTITITASGTTPNVTIVVSKRISRAFEWFKC